MELIAKVNRHTHIEYWVKLWNGGLMLTEKEQTFLGEILFITMDLIDKGITEPYLGQLVFSSNAMAEIRGKLGLTKQGLNNYKMALKEKGVIFKDDGGIYHIKEQLLPKNNITFKFDYE